MVGRSQERPERELLVLMGVSGCGKTASAQHLARVTHWPMIEGDDFHPPANIEKMAVGVPLTDVDRMPWIDSIAKIVNRLDDPQVLLACSALTQPVRERLADKVTRPCRWIMLDVPEAILRQRLEMRDGHFMPASLLVSQLAALDVPANAQIVDASQPLEAVCQTIVDGLNQRIK